MLINQNSPNSAEQNTSVYRSVTFFWDVERRYPAC